MANSEHTKQRLLALAELLRRETDENHHLSAPALVKLLKAQGIPAERKSLYQDISALEDGGWDILRDKEGYYLASGTFELAELKLLADAVQCSRFITQKKSRELIEKLETLTSRYHASQLRRQLHLVGRSKASNEQIYYNVDKLYTAINRGREITFDYLEWHSNGTRRKKDRLYRASPYALCWDSENYYLVAHAEPHGRTHYRVDKMANITLLDTPGLHPELYRDLDMAQYSKQVFGMFGGASRAVTLQFPEELADSAVDKFGSDCMMVPQGDGTFTLTATVAVSPVFFSWVFSFAGRVKILAPATVAEQYREMCRAAIAAYQS